MKPKTNSVQVIYTASLLNGQYSLRYTVVMPKLRGIYVIYGDNNITDLPLYIHLTCSPRRKY